MSKCHVGGAAFRKLALELGRAERCSEPLTILT